MVNDCIFCRIINKEIPAQVVFENDRVIAFNDINPLAPVHVLIAPKEHIENVAQINEKNVDVIGEIHLAANQIAKIKGIESFRMITNCGKEVGQSVFHLHYHLLGGKEILDLI